MAVGAGGGKEGNDVMTLVGGLEEAGGPFVAGLAAGLSARGSGLGRVLGSGGGIGRGRARGVRGVLVKACLQPGLMGLELEYAGAQLDQLGVDGWELGQLGFQLGDAGLERPAAGALGVGRAHTPGFKL
jgi:hypothetical protein